MQQNQQQLSIGNNNQPLKGQGQEQIQEKEQKQNQSKYQQMNSECQIQQLMQLTEKTFETMHTELERLKKRFYNQLMGQVSNTNTIQDNTSNIQDNNNNSVIQFQEEQQIHKEIREKFNKYLNMMHIDISGSLQNLNLFKVPTITSSTLTKKETGFRPTLITSSNEGYLCVWNPLSGKSLKKLRRSDPLSNPFIKEPHSPYIVSGCYENLIKINMLTGELGEHQVQIDGTVWCVEEIAKRHLIALGNSSGQVQIYHMEKLEEVFSVYGHKKNVSCLGVFRRQKKLLSGGFDKEIKLWDFSDRENIKPIQVYQGHSGWISSIAVLTSEDKFVSASYDYTIKLWNVDSGVLLATFKNNTSTFNSVCLLPQTNFIATGDRSGSLKIFNANEDWKCEVDLSKVDSSLIQVKCVPGKERVLSAGSNGRVSIWSITKKTSVRHFETSKSSTFCHLRVVDE